MRGFFLFLTVITFLTKACTLTAEDQKSGEARQQQIQELLAVITNDEIAKKDRPKVVDAILELGELKAAGAAPQLAEKLDFHVSATGDLEHYAIPSAEESYPAIKALRKIGKPAEKSVIGAVASKDRSELFRRNARIALFRIYGENKQWEVKDALTKATEQEKDKEKPNASKTWPSRSSRHFQDRRKIRPSAKAASDRS